MLGLMSSILTLVGIVYGLRENYGVAYYLLLIATLLD